MPVASQKSAMAPSANGISLVIEPLVSRMTLSIVAMALAAGQHDVGALGAAPRRPHESALAGRRRLRASAGSRPARACGGCRAAHARSAVDPPASVPRPRIRPIAAAIAMPLAARSRMARVRAACSVAVARETSRARACASSTSPDLADDDWSDAERLIDRHDVAIPHLRARRVVSALRRISSTISSADRVARTRHVEAAGRNGRHAERMPQHVVDDVVVRVVEFEMAASRRRGHACAAPDAATHARARTADRRPTAAR